LDRLFGGGVKEADPPLSVKAGERLRHPECQRVGHAALRVRRLTGADCIVANAAWRSVTSSANFSTDSSVITAVAPNLPVLRTWTWIASRRWPRGARSS